RYGRLGTLRGARVGAQGYGEGRAAGERADLESRRGVEGTRAALLA
ncbi:MAG: hypothetical protein JST73_08025, partial [Actinobacteria bacterium]|nr:hypothetical protein [Actinomycetota bacterium]